MKKKAAPIPSILALLAGLGLAGAACAGEAHGEEHAAPVKAAAKVEVKPTRPLHADRVAEKPQAGKPEGAPAEGKAAISMAELRDLIDQKIAEVRAQQAAAPVVRVNNPAPRARKPAALAGAARPAAHVSTPRLSATPAPMAGERPGDHGHDVHWAYAGDTGPQSWGRLKPEFQQCMLGKRQSPIDIRDGIKVQLEPIQFEYRDTPFRVVDNGHTVQVNVEPGNSIMVNGRRYDLVQFHFHRPSEERINGRQYEMVAHLVHKDADGKLAVVAVLMDQGRQHPMVQLVWNSLPLERNTEQASPVMMDMNGMLPEQRQYYTYMGSLTTPPCSEGVLWMVMKHPATMTREQIDIFSRLYPMNARPIQSASGRLIKDGQ